MMLYYVLLHFWSARCAGNSPLALRMPSILFSVTAVPAIYWLGRRLFNQNVGLVAAFILAGNATAVDYAQIVRSYSLLILLVVASLFFFVKLVAIPKARATDAWPYIIASVLAVYAHLHATFTLIAHALSASFPERRALAHSDRVGRDSRIPAVLPPLRCDLRQLSRRSSIGRCGYAAGKRWRR